MAGGSAHVVARLNAALAAYLSEPSEGKKLSCNPQQSSNLYEVHGMLLRAEEPLPIRGFWEQALRARSSRRVSGSAIGGSLSTSAMLELTEDEVASSIEVIWCERSIVACRCCCSSSLMRQGRGEASQGVEAPALGLRRT